MKIETVAAGMCAAYYPTQKGFDSCLSVAQVVGLAQGEEEDKLRHWVEKDRGRAVPLGMGVHVGPAGRGEFRRASEKKRPSLTGATTPNVESWKVRGPISEVGEQFEEVTVHELAHRQGRLN